MGEQIVLVTEGPEDAQQWTLEHLGIADKVDALITSNAIGKSKVDGLFGVVFQQLGIEAGDMVFVGDDWKRDVLPARQEGIMTVFYDEQGSVRLDGDELRINSLWKLGELVKAPVKSRPAKMPRYGEVVEQYMAKMDRVKESKLRAEVLRQDISEIKRQLKSRSTAPLQRSELMFENI
ncbi:MAG: hypothetical protein Q9207_003329 [Kuettlingeria erythrocarpa]